MTDFSDATVFDALTVHPAQAPLTGRISPPGSKSITNRALLIAALASGTSHITGALKSKDTTLMARALRAMGVQVEEPDATTFVVTSQGALQPPDEPLFLGNAGTATRFLTAAVCLAQGEVVVDGDAHMRKRPIGPLVSALQSLGVSISDTGGYPPVTVQATGALGYAGRVEIDASLSSQYISALLMAAGAGNRPVEVQLAGPEIGARGYVDLTTAAMEAFGGAVAHPDPATWIVAPTGYRAVPFPVEPDASAATYLWAWNALTGGDVDLGVSAERFTQPDAKAAHVIDAFPNMPPTIDGSQMQDAVPTLAVLAAFNQTPVRFTGIENLRVKECDRTHALATELNRIKPGLATEDGDDLIVHADPSLAGQTHPTRVETYADHRIAMSFALAGLKIHGITILDPGCVGKTYPGYWADLARAGARLEALG